jgi:hypothetical protein
LQPDTIIPDLSNPQYLNRYSYVVNNPILYNDPDGHCGGPACVIVLPVALVALVAIGITYYSQPQVQAAGQEFMTSVSNTVDDWRFPYPNKRNIERQEANYNKTFDDGLLPGPGYKTPKCGWACWSTIGSVITYIVYKVYCSADEEKCPPPKKPISPTPTATTTNTTGCTPPYAVCSNTSTPTATTTLSPSAIPTATSSNTPTKTTIPTSTASPAIPLSVEEKRLLRKGLLE